MSITDSSDIVKAKASGLHTTTSKGKPARHPEANQNLKSKSTLISKNVTVSGRRTSVRLEPEVWSAIDDLMHRENIDRNQIFSLIASRLVAHQSLTSAVRSFVITYYRESSTESGHVRAGHGAGRSG
jgi:predicted DNA-binding ribbon-helix-helix protein